MNRFFTGTIRPGPFFYEPAGQKPMSAVPGMAPIVIALVLSALHQLQKEIQA